MATRKNGNGKRGRPRFFTNGKKARAIQLWAEGARDEDIASELGCTVVTLYRELAHDPSFLKAEKEIKAMWDQQVERDLQLLGRGRLIPEKGAAPPNVTALIFWLKNRQPERWRDRHEIAHSGKVSLEDVILGEADEG